MVKELIEGKPNVLCDLTEQDGRNITALMKRHGSASALRISKLLVRPALTDFREAERNKNGYDLARFENGDVPHRLGDRDVLHANKLGLQVGLTVFEKHGDDFLKVVVHLVESLALRVGAGEAGDKPHKEFGLGAALNDGRIDPHNWLQLRECSIINLPARTMQHGRLNVQVQGRPEASKLTRCGPACRVVPRTALRGVQLVCAATLVAEIGDIGRFDNPRQLMAYLGLTPSEYSSGQSVHRGGITKCGNSHARRMLTEAAWSYRLPARITPIIARRQDGQTREVRDIAWKAQVRLCGRYRLLRARGKEPNKVVIAVARELAGFVWAIARATRT